jgi:Leucine-rich repeat (LRR) protein
MLNLQNLNHTPNRLSKGFAMSLHMKKSIFFLFFAVITAFGLGAQTTAGNEHPMLNTAQLDKEPVYTDLDSALANPDKVYKLSLMDQKIKVLPAEFGQFKNLQILTLSNCKLKAIPLEIKECKNLQVVTLYGNKLRVLPVEMRELKHIEVLYLGRNRLLEIPNWFGTLNKIRRLDISRNGLTPADVANAKRMLPKAVITY